MTARNDYELTPWPSPDETDQRKLRPMIARVAARLGLDVREVDKLDRAGILPHAGKKAYSPAGKHVMARYWNPADVDNYAKTLQ